MIDSAFRERLVSFVRPLYQDLDGGTRFEDVERIARIARLLYRPETEQDEYALEILLLLAGLEKWLEKIGNQSRCLLVVGPPLTHSDLRRAIQSIHRLEQPASAAERAVAAARLIDDCGVRGLAQRISRARREGFSISESVMESAARTAPPSWLVDPKAIRLLEQREGRRIEFANQLREENELIDLEP